MALLLLAHPTPTSVTRTQYDVVPLNERTGNDGASLLGIGDTVDGQSHAWVQAWTGGWLHYDPTNGSEINEQYVSVGVGRDYSDVSPLKGIYSGEGSTDLDVVVEITRLA